MTSPDSLQQPPAAGAAGHDPLDVTDEIDFSDLGEWERRAVLPFEERWDGEGPMPETRLLAGPAIPHLSQIHPRRWASALIPLPDALRWKAVMGPGMSGSEVGAGLELVKRLPAPPDVLAAEAIAERAGGLPKPPVGRRPVTRQVNVRLSEREHRELETAAEIAGTRPTTFARWLLLSGTRSVLAEHAAAYAAVRDARD